MGKSPHAPYELCTCTPPSNRIGRPFHCAAQMEKERELRFDQTIEYLFDIIAKVASTEFEAFELGYAVGNVINTAYNDGMTLIELQRRMVEYVKEIHSPQET